MVKQGNICPVCNGDKVFMGDTCLVCKGAGEYKPSSRKHKDMEKKSKAALIMKEKGYSMREIMSALGYKSPRSIQYFLNERKNKK